MNVGICKLCGNAKESVRTHIIPIFLYPEDVKRNRMDFVYDENGKLPRSKLSSG